MAKPLNDINLPINPNTPLIMHVDMNSCFATIEQQANPLIRGRTVCVSPYTTPRGITIAPSIEAKKLGIRLGMRNFEVKQIDPNAIILPPDPAKYRDAHMRFKKIFTSYTNTVTPKSIDEAVIDFTGSRDVAIEARDMHDIARDIKKRVQAELGEWVRVSIGISTNRFLAKVGAGLSKPDGLDTIDKGNLLEVYRALQLTDLPGINVRNEARLNANGIFTPLQFFAAPMVLLKKQVFQSINGYYWYMRLRGWEIDDVPASRKSFGHNYALGKKTADVEKLATLIMKLCEKTGRRLRRHGYYAQGVFVAVLHEDNSSWHKSRRVSTRLYLTQDIFRHVLRIFNSRPDRRVVTNLSVGVHYLQPFSPQQLSIFDNTKSDKTRLAKSMDEINDRYGEFVVTPALMMGMNDTILDRVAFGGVKDLEDLYER